MKAADQTGQHRLIKAIGRWTLTALVVNSVIGAGIFGLPSVLAGLLGSASVYAYLFATAGMTTIVACFAEVASRFPASGGPYLYAREAFGRFAGIQMGWLLWLVRLTAAAANVNLFVVYLAEWWPSADRSVTRIVLLTVLIGVLAVVNYRGVSGAAALSNVLTIAKVFPLAIFVGVGLFFIHPSQVAATTAATGNWLQAVLVLVYALGGFEGALMPLGEAKNPGRDAPFALLSGVLICALIYTLIQVVVVGVLPSAATTDRAIAVAARQFMGAAGSVGMMFAALLCIYGYLSSQSLNVPRLTFALSEHGDFPSFFGAVHKRFATPYISVLAFSGLVWMLAVWGNFRWNLTLSAIARLFTYGLVCGSLPVLRRKQPNSGCFRLPAGPLFATGGVAFTLLLASRIRMSELLVLAVTTAIAAINWLWARSRRVDPKRGISEQRIAVQPD